MDSFAKYNQLKYQLLQHYWGHQNFRENQEDIIDSIFYGNDTLVLLPTGGGKSLCYQIPALLLEGTCLVISPLIALMKDQVQQLQSMGIEAEYLTSELDEFAAEEVFSLCRQGITKLLYVSPERLNNKIFLENIAEIPISFIAVDEAHCISEWGQDFRPSYQNIHTFRQIYPVPCIALTATATQTVLEQIKGRLKLKKPNLFVKSFLRTNLFILPDQIADKYQRIHDLMHLHNSSGIIYTRTRKEAEDLAQYLKKDYPDRLEFYHAGLASKSKTAKQNWWLKSPNNVLVSTNAFGMGIDKDNVRFIIHFSPSATLENYYQEIGRAGRDGQDGQAYLLWNENELKNFDEILKNQIPSKSEFSKIVTYLYSIFQVADGDQPQEQFQLPIQKLKNFTKCSNAKIAAVLNFLHNQEIIFWKSYKSYSTVEMKITTDQIEELSQKDSYFLELLTRNLPGIANKRVLFSEAALAKKIGTDPLLLRERIKDLQQMHILDYLDGALGSVTFLKPREDKAVEGKMWQLFEQIQKNKIVKWEEMKFFLRDTDNCKMKLILSYFGEKKAQNCGKCTYCLNSYNHFFQDNTADQILQILKTKPSTLNEISLQLYHVKKEKILENLILLLDSGKVKMLNFQTYTVA